MVNTERKTPRGHTTGFQSTYDFKKGQPHIGDFSFYRKTYLSDPVVQTNINIPCRYIWKSGWYVQGRHKEAARVVKEYMDKVGIDQIGYRFIKDSKIFGTGYMEYTPDNLYTRNPDSMFVRIDRKGRIVGWEQKVASSFKPIHFNKDEIIFMPNNPFSDSVYGISDIESVRYIVRYLKDQAERDVGAMLNKYVGERFKITGGSADNPFQETELEILKEYFSELKFGEDIITAGDVGVDSIASSAQGMDFRAYLDYIVMILSIGMNVPIVFWEGKSSTNATATVQLQVFESYVKFLQRQIEDAFNTQLIPNIIRDFLDEEVEMSDYPKFVFEPINNDELYVQAKTELIHLTNGVLSPAEVREKRGYNQRTDLPEDLPAFIQPALTGATGKPDPAKEMGKQTGQSRISNQEAEE